MYLPLGSLTLSRLLQLPLLLSNSDRPEQSEDYKNFDHLGNLFPYHDAPVVAGTSVKLPDDCTVDKVILLHRHGSRGPVGEQSHILKLVDTLDKAKDIIRAADLPPSLEFLREGYEYDLVPEELTIVGRQQLFDHGVQFALDYPTFSTDEVISTTVQRVVDSAHSFSQGFFGRAASNVTFLTEENFKDPVPWLRPWKSCPKLSDAEASQTALRWAERFVPPIVDRLNNLIPGVGFSFDDIRGALYACPYDLAAHNKSPWCSVFTAHELRDLEYQFDLYLDSYSGHASRGDPGPLIGAFYIKKLIERLTEPIEKAKPLYLDFAHEFTILFPMSTMGLNKDAVPLSPLVPRPPAHRKFRSSNQTPFAANMVWEKFTCKESFDGPQTSQDKQYGTCSLDAFIRANKYSLDVEYGSKTWDATCGH